MTSPLGGQITIHLRIVGWHLIKRIGEKGRKSLLNRNSLDLSPSDAFLIECGRYCVFVLGRLLFPSFQECLLALLVGKVRVLFVPNECDAMVFQECNYRLWNCALSNNQSFVFWLVQNELNLQRQEHGYLFNFHFQSPAYCRRDEENCQERVKYNSFIRNGFVQQQTIPVPPSLILLFLLFDG